MKYGLIENVLPWDTCIIASSAMIHAPKGTYEDIGEDEQVPVSKSFSKPPFLEVLLPYVRPQLEKFWGVELTPTYVYSRILYPGSELKKHSDRPSCQYSVTVTLGHNYSEDFQYPIYMDGTPIDIPVGWGATYKGCEVEHWRDPLIGSVDNFWIQAFFHFVDADGEYADHAWDKRFA